MPRIHYIPWLRKPALSVLRRLNRDISIKHHWVRKPFLLNLFHHKGYWYHGRERERPSIEYCHKLIKPADIVFEVGGHIGYLTQIFASLAKNVVVFEPGQNNLRYLKQNIGHFDNIQLVEKAVADSNGTARFYLDPLTGQNNSLVKDYYIFSRNRALADNTASTTETVVEMVALDDFARQTSLSPNFVKIDVEGAELKVLQGMKSVLENSRPKIMIEISENHEQVEHLLRSSGYRLYTPRGEELTGKMSRLDDIFAIPT